MPKTGSARKKAPAYVRCRNKGLGYGDSKRASCGSTHGCGVAFEGLRARRRVSRDASAPDNRILGSFGVQMH